MLKNTLVALTNQILNVAMVVARRLVLTERQVANSSRDLDCAYCNRRLRQASERMATSGVSKNACNGVVTAAIRSASAGLCGSRELAAFSANARLRRPIPILAPTSNANSLTVIKRTPPRVNSRLGGPRRQDTFLLNFEVWQLGLSTLLPLRPGSGQIRP